METIPQTVGTPKKFSFPPVIMTETERHRIRGIRVTDGEGNDITNTIMSMHDLWADISDDVLEKMIEG